MSILDDDGDGDDGDDDDRDDDDDDDDVEVSRSDAWGVARSDAPDVSRSDAYAKYSETLFKPTWGPNMFRKEYCVCEHWIDSLNLILKPLKRQWLPLLRYTFEGKPSAWTDPNLQPGRFSLSIGKQTSEWRLSHGASSSSARLDVWMHYCCVYGFVGLWADNIALMNISCGSTSVPFGLHVCSWDWSPFIFQ